MATASPYLPPPVMPDSFADALEGVIAGVAGLELARRMLAATLDQEEGAAAAQDLLDDAHEAGRLGAEEYAALTADINRYLGEDVPTEWSQELVDEAAPGSDTLSPGETQQATDVRSGTGLQPGAVLMQRFVLQGRLGATGTSDVLKAIDRQRQQAHAGNPWVALKLVVPGTAHHAQSRQMLQREAALAQALQHPHIARVFGFAEDDRHALLAMEWLDGESLAELLTRQRYRPLTLAHTRQILGEVADALHFAHGQGITHADIKPGNIFICRDGSARLLDFGVARSSADPPRPATARTPAYASCEVLEGEPPTPQDDVYSLACVAYRMLAGRRVFGHHDALAAEQAGRKPAAIRNLPGPQWQALAQALALRREARTPDIASFISAFSATPPVATATYRPAAAISPAAEPAPAPVAPTPKPRRPRRPAWQVAAAMATVLAAAGLILLSRPGEAPPPAAPAGTAMPAPGPTAMPPPLDVAPPAATPPAAATAATTTEPAATPPATDRPATHRLPQQQAEEAAPSVPTPPPVAPAEPMPPAASLLPAPAPAPEVPAPEAPGLAGTDATTSAASTSTGPTAAPALVAAAEVTASPPAPVPAAEAGPREVPLGDLELLRYVKPAEPQLLPGSVGRGWVSLAFVVGTDGHTRDVQVTGSEPAGDYDEVALRAVQRWRFAPVLEDGQPVERRTQVRLRFEPAP
ncbi:MAG: TonB family protein [Gammaproteobacteria bacterium]|nr:MAG: TonB family protein [Gammaproteobacteria bacterium]